MDNEVILRILFISSPRYVEAKRKAIDFHDSSPRFWKLNSSDHVINTLFDRGAAERRLFRSNAGYISLYPNHKINSHFPSQIGLNLDLFGITKTNGPHIILDDLRDDLTRKIPHHKYFLFINRCGNRRIALAGSKI